MKNTFHGEVMLTTSKLENLRKKSIELYQIQNRTLYFIITLWGDKKDFFSGGGEENGEGKGGKNLEKENTSESEGGVTLQQMHVLLLKCTMS